MSPQQRAVYFFCADLEKDPVATHVLEAATRLSTLSGTGLSVDGYPVLTGQDAAGNELLYVRTAEVLSHDYPRYLPLLDEHFSGYDMAAVVNWHAGEKAPDAILTVHTTGDVVSGHYGLAHPVWMRNLLLALDRHRQALGLEGFTTTTEATHWSGIPYGGDPTLVPRYGVPLVDIEIGSSPASWSNPVAAEVVARSLLDVFTPRGDEARLRSLLCLGGVHLEPAFVTPVLASQGTEHPLAVSHILPNHWLVAGGYETPSGLERLQACARTIIGGVHGVVFHDNLKGPFKAQARQLGELLGLPAFKHQALRQPGGMALW